MKTPPFSAVIVATFYFASCSALSAQASPPAPPPERASARITLESGEVAKASGNRGIFDRVGLRPNELIKIVLHYPPAKAGQTILAGALDGGRVIAPRRELTVAADGTVEFRFQAGKEPGIYQVSLQDGSDEMGLQFWVMNDKHPEHNPPVINKKK